MWSRTLTWQIKWDDRALKEFRKLNKVIQKDIRDYLVKRISTAKDPRDFGKPLKSNLSGLWRYRIADYRVICRIQDNEFTVLVLRVDHRSRVYNR